MRRAASGILWVVLAVPPAFAEGEEAPKALSGGVEVGYRDVSVDGNEDKYREDVNLDDQALRLFGLDLDYRPQGSGLLDEATLAAEGLGGEPFASARMRVHKVGLYDVKASWRSSEFFYRDAGYFFREGGDLHSWDAKRQIYDLDLRVTPAKWVTLRLDTDRLDRTGFSTTSRDIQRDEFVLDRPVDQVASSYNLGVDFALGWADLSVDRRAASYENRWLLTTSGNPGEEPGGATLDTYQALQVQDADAPVTRISFGGKPVESFRFDLAYARVEAEMDHHTEGTWSGQDYDDPAAPPEPFQTTLVNGGQVTRDTDLWSARATYSPAGSIDLTADVSRRSYDQDGDLDYLETQTGGKEAGTYTVRGALQNQLDLDQAGLTAHWRAMKTLSLSGGVGYQKRKATFELAGPAVETERTLYRLGARWRPNDRFDLRLDAETASDDDPYTQVSPTSVDRIRLDVKIRPVQAFGISLRYKDESRENDLAYALGLATDDNPPATQTATAVFGVTAYGLTLDWKPKTWADFLLGYDRTEIDSNADIVYVTGYSFLPVFDIFTTLGRTAYVSEQDALMFQARFRIGKAWSAGLNASQISNDGTFPLDWARYGAEGRYAHGSGLYVRLAYDRYDLDETNPYAGAPAAPTPDVNDYTADLWTVAVGYRF